MTEYTPTITLEQAERSAHYVRDTAKEYSVLVGKCKGLEQKRKIVFGEQFLKAEGKNVAEREAKAYASDAFRAVVEEIENSWAGKTEIETLTVAAEMTNNTWRSSHAGNKKVEKIFR